MLRRTAGRIAAAADLLRPRTLFRTLARVDTLADRTRELTEAVETLRIQTDQLLTIQRVDWDKRFELVRMDRWLNADRIRVHLVCRLLLEKKKNTTCDKARGAVGAPTGSGKDSTDLRGDC